MSIRIVTDSASDLTADEARALDVRVIPLTVNFEEEQYRDGVDLTRSEFYEKLIESDVLPKTSQVPPYAYEEVYEEMTANGDQVLCIAVSSKLSGCYQSAVIGAEDYEGKVFIVDSLNVCIGQRILVDLAAQMRDQGMAIEDIVAELEKEKMNIRLVALLDTLEYLKKGGRISAAVALAGSLLSIKPVIAVENGEISMLGKARGSKAANNKLHELIAAEKGIDFSKPACLGYSGLSDAILNKYIKDHAELYNQYPGQIPVTQIGSVIGTHVGPGAIGVTFFVK